MKRFILLLMVPAIIIAIVALLFAPYIYVEIFPYRYSFPRVSDAPVELNKGEIHDDYFAVEYLGDDTYAIGEPRYYQANYSYLIIGDNRALLFDAGSGTRDIWGVIERLTDLPVTILPSHLHFDHFAGIKASDRLALVDLPSTRSRIRNDLFRPGRYEFLGMFDGLKASSIPVAEWIAPDALIELGGRSVQLIFAPGHTPSSVMIYDQKGTRIFTGDFIYPTMLYAFLPGANVSDYRKTTKRLLTELPSDTRLWTGHCCRRGGGFAAPWLTMADVADLDRAFELIDAGELEPSGLFPRRYRVNDQMDIGLALSLR